MRRVLFSAGILAVLSAVVLQSVRSQPEPPKPGSNADKEPGKPDRSADEAAIRANIDAFEKAYNAGDAKAVAALFTSDGRIIDKEGDVTDGREAIAEDFAELFKEYPKKQIEIFVESIRFLGPDLAMEVGMTKETLAPGEPPEIDRYTVLHVKRDGKWQMALARDEEGPPPSAHEQLKPLAWLVGEWMDDGGSTVVWSACRWSNDGNFLLQDFRLQVNGRDAMTVSQRIGWDPVAKQIRSWVFDSEGGFGESVWTQDDDAWIIRATGVRPDGTTAAATNHLSRSGADGYIWRSTDRVIAGETQPDTEIKVVRKPPDPKK
jgi:uncharacterized protein (TIGR02246 family)